jgi:uncharacterized repeat protein (TIGR01451 family)
VYLSDNSGATLTNNIISDNSGSGLYIKGSSPRLLHTTIARNSGGDGSGVYVTEDVGMFYSFYSTVALTNTILVSHAVGVYVTADNTATLEGTLWGDGAWANGTDWSGEGNITTGTVNLWGDPAFLDPDDGDYHISFGSAAVDAGVDAGVTDDIDGDPRTDGYPDMGADELMGALLVTKQAYPDPVQPGAPLTYTIRVTNTGDFALHATITDTLPTYVTTGETAGGTTVLPGGRLVWTPVITTPHGVWVRTVVVTVELGYAGSLTNVVQVTTDEGAMGVYTETSVTAPSNRAPYTPSNPAPADGASNVPLTQTLSWQGGDPNAGDTVTYAVALGTSDPPLFATTTTLTSYTPSLVTNTTYCWVITATDGISAVVGPMWRFTTLGLQYIYLPVVLRDSP